MHRVPELYKTASLLGVGSCARMCAKYLAEHLRPDHCIGQLLWDFSFGKLLLYNFIT